MTDKTPSISDDASEDEQERILGLEEDQGIYHHEEIVVTPARESDDDITVNKTVQMQKDHLQQPQSDDDDDFLPPPSPESLSYIKALENPMAARGEDQISHSEDYDLLNQLSPPGYPPSSPPAYAGLGTYHSPNSPAISQSAEARRSSLTTSGPPPSSLLPTVPPANNIQPTGQMTNNTLPNGAPNNNSQGNGRAESSKSTIRGSLNELLINRVAAPLQSIIRRASRIEMSTEDDDAEDLDDHDVMIESLTEDEMKVLGFNDAYRAVEENFTPVFKPFIYNYIPAVGDIDPHIKVPRPDEVDDNVGITHLDEPALQQSDSTIVDMELRNASKEVTRIEDAPVKLIKRPDKNKPLIEKWIADIKELHKKQPPKAFAYKGAMPDIDTVMAEWPPELEKKLKQMDLPDGSLDCSLEEFINICVNIVDIPVHKGKIQALHLFFTVYMAFNESQHFRNLAENKERDGDFEHMDRLEL